MLSLNLVSSAEGDLIKFNYKYKSLQNSFTENVKFLHYI